MDHPRGFSRLLLRVLPGVLLVLAALGPPLPARAGGAFVVNSSGDTDFYDPYLTLREAIKVANGDYAPSVVFSAGEQTQLVGCVFNGAGQITGGCGAGVDDEISFAPSVSRIDLGVPLPALTDAGTTILGDVATANPRIDAALLSSGHTFTINGNRIDIAFLTIVNGAPTWDDIYVQGGTGAQIWGNHIGAVGSAENCSSDGVTRFADVGVYVGPLASGSAGTGNGAAYINATGNGAIPNGEAGVAIRNHADYTAIGDESDPVYISGNQRQGIYARDSAHLYVESATVGVISGTTLAELGNHREGIKLDSGVTDSVIYPSVVANSGNAGITTLATNLIVPEMVFDNGWLPVDLGDNGRTLNDAADHCLGPDGWLDYPELTIVHGQVIGGLACPGTLVYVYQAIGNPAAKGGGGSLLGASEPADISGSWVYTLPASVRPVDVALLAAGPAGSSIGSSEMSPHMQVLMPLIQR
jgi:hypothetical protein